MTQNLEQRIIRSSLWAAYGDALGFPTELVDEEGVRRRVGKRKILQTTEWKRLVGGRFGVWANLMAGAYSDDTQLRLATARSIRGDGHFDIETFAKIELPVWLSYALGAGRGSKVGATALGQRGVNWFSNFFDQRDIKYVNGGGNGAAMRIQPHVWASADLSIAETYLPDVIRNTICTHGHPRAIAGSIIHAACLASMLQDNSVPPPDDWLDLGLYIDWATKFIVEDPELSMFWLPTWERMSGRSFEFEMEAVKDEWMSDVDSCRPLLDGEPELAYEGIVRKLGGLSPEQRGSGVKCALFSLVAAWCFRDKAPDAALVTVVNLLSSDTDTIGTMVGSLLGAVSQQEPSHPIQDSKYIVKDASRLYAIGQGHSAESFQYPDLTSWQAPKAQLDAIGTVEGGIALAGLGIVHPVSEEFVGSKNDFSYQWFTLEFGQTVLCKRRRNLALMEMSSLPATIVPPKGYNAPSKLEKTIPEKRLPASNLSGRSLEKEGYTADFLASAMRKPLNLTKVPPSFWPHQNASHAESDIKQRFSLDEMTDLAIKSGFDPALIGEHLLRLVERPNGIELAVSYTAIIAKARVARLGRGR